MILKSSITGTGQQLRRAGVQKWSDCAAKEYGIELNANFSYTF